MTTNEVGIAALIGRTVAWDSEDDDDEEFEGTIIVACVTPHGDIYFLVEDEDTHVLSVVNADESRLK